ncbi:MAG: helix-turn-helix domain-containing protein [Lachnospiraceae bacterium]
MMILADKIVNLRKKAGWSQEEMAEKLGVSRQAVSKWESAQSVPDLNKILALSKTFGVSTDYPLRDECGEPEEVAEPAALDDGGEKLLPVSLEEANAFLAQERALAPRIACGVFLCIVSSVPLLLLTGAQEAHRIRMTREQASASGVALLLLLVGIGVFWMVLVSGVWDSYQVLLEEGEFTRERKRNGRRYGGIYWSLAIALYLFVSFLTGAWQFTWVVWPAAGALWAMLGLRQPAKKGR